MQRSDDLQLPAVVFVTVVGFAEQYDPRLDGALEQRLDRRGLTAVRAWNHPARHRHARRAAS